MTESKRYFSVDEANATIPEVRRIFERAIPVSLRLQNRKPQIDEIVAKNVHNSGGPEGTAYVEDLLMLQQYLEAVAGLGVLVKDVERGLVDFPYDRNGHEVYLCWQYGEESIRFWHEIDAGFAGRRPIEEL